MIARRLLATLNDGPSLDAHQHHHGPMPRRPDDLIAEVERSGLLGRGGAGFPLARKLATVAAQRGPAVVLANGCEGEPASGKDTLLMSCAPHLVLDGVQVAAAAVRADTAHLAVHEGSPALPALRTALGDRRGDAVPVTVTHVPARYVASEESALVSRINGGPALPAFTPPRPFERGVGGQPTLVNNVETLAQLALIARHGSGWFRQVGDSDEPGTRLLSVSRVDADQTVRPSVHEVTSGTTVDHALALSGLDVELCSAVLVGGWFGTWISAADARGLPLTHAGLRGVGGALGAGVLVALPRRMCGLVETARIARYLADQSARQCGPCLNGLPLIAQAVDALADGTWNEQLAPALERWMAVVPGRGACRHPDGAVRMVASALEVFAHDVAQHRSGRTCAGTHQQLTASAWRTS